MMCIATMKNMTAAQRGQKYFRAAGIDSQIVNLDATLTKGGCAYGLSFNAYSPEDAKRLLSSRRIPYGELIIR